MSGFDCSLLEEQHFQTSDSLKDGAISCSDWSRFAIASSTGFTLLTFSGHSSRKVQLFTVSWFQLDQHLEQDDLRYYTYTPLALFCPDSLRPDGARLLAVASSTGQLVICDANQESPVVLFNVSKRWRSQLDERNGGAGANARKPPTSNGTTSTNGGLSRDEEALLVPTCLGWSNVLRRDSPSRFVLLFCGLESGHVAIWQLSEQQQTNNLTLTYAALLEPNATEPTISSVNGTKKPGQSPSMSNGLHNSKTDSPYRSPHNSISAMAWLSLSDTAGILALGSSHGHVSLISISLTGNELAPLLAYTKQESPHLVSNGARIHHIALYQQHNEHRLFFAQMDSIVIATLNISSTGYNTSCSQFTIKTVNEYALNSSVLTHFLSEQQDLYLICRDGFIHKQVTQTFNDPHHHHHHQQHATRFEQFCQLLPAGSDCQAAGITPTHCTVLIMKRSEAILTLSVYSLKDVSSTITFFLSNPLPSFRLNDVLAALRVLLYSDKSNALTDLIMSVADCADQASVSLLKKVHSLCRLLLSYHNSGLGNGLRQAPYMLFLADVFAQMISIDLIKKLYDYVQNDHQIQLTAIEKSILYWCEQLLQFSTQQLQASANATNNSGNINTNLTGNNLTAQFGSLLAMANPNMTTTPITIANGPTPPAQINSQYLSTCDQKYLHCQLCGQILHIRTFFDVTCPNGHEFQRCNKTFLPIFVQDRAKRCSLCNFYISDTTIDESTQLTALIKILGGFTCTFCG